MLRWLKRKKEEQEPEAYDIITYQSMQVLEIIRSGQVYRAYKSISFAREYQALIDILGLKCVCPIFGCTKGKRQCADGRVSSSVLLTLRVPKEFVKLTEYGAWADLLYVMKSTKSDYTGLGALQGRSDVNTRQLQHSLESLKQQKKLWQYKVPQAVLEEIRPEWLVEFKRQLPKK